MMALAIHWGVRAEALGNPCHGVSRYKERRRQRFLSSAELVRLGVALFEVEREGSEHASVVPAIRLLILTGARRGEVLGLRWEYVSWERQSLELPDSKTGAKTIHLNAPALQVLRALWATRPDDEHSPWVLSGRHEGRALVDLSHPWARIRTRAGLDGVRLHDLRHSFASFATAHNMSLPIIGALLGHSQPATTARYAHLAADPLKDATEQIGGRIAALMNPRGNLPATLWRPRKQKIGKHARSAEAEK
jgi:integrase